MQKCFLMRGPIAFPPFDITPNTRFLVSRNRLARKRRVHGRAQILSRHGLAVAGTAVVKLTAVDEAALRIEEKEIGRAGGSVGLSDRLAVVMAERKRESLFSCERFE